MALVGCGKKTTPAEPEVNAEPKVAANKPEPPETELKPVAKIPAKSFTNTLGMVFKPVPGTEVSFCIWETRVKDYAAYVAANTGVDGSWKSPGFFKRKGFKQPDTHPVGTVSWNDAQAFCAWLTKKELAEGKIKAGQKYRLPTDAEWSIAVGLGQEQGSTPKEKNGGNKGVYPWGKEWPPPKGAGNYGDVGARTGRTLRDLKGRPVDGYEYTSPVASFAANRFGLHDLGGNVWEWCEDWYNPSAKEWRVLRGARWHTYDPDVMLSSFRHVDPPDCRDIDVGFRCVLVSGSGG